jgi:hypothetical protein
MPSREPLKSTIGYIAVSLETGIGRESFTISCNAWIYISEVLEFILDENIFHSRIHTATRL